MAQSPSTCTGCSRSSLSERQEVDVEGKNLLLYEVNPGMHMVADRKISLTLVYFFNFEKLRYTKYNVWLWFTLLKRRCRDFPGSPVGKTLLPVQGAWVRSLAGELRSRMPCSKKIFLNTRYSHVLSGLPVPDTEPDTPRTLSCLRQTTEHQRQGCRGLNPSLALFNLCVLAKFA